MDTVGKKAEQADNNMDETGGDVNDARSNNNNNVTNNNHGDNDDEGEGSSEQRSGQDQSEVESEHLQQKQSCVDGDLDLYADVEQRQIGCVGGGDEAALEQNEDKEAVEINVNINDEGVMGDEHSLYDDVMGPGSSIKVESRGWL